jgi:glyoxylase-like metal-dependent hydrolase (beta-lactamase superfamily II)
MAEAAAIPLAPGVWRVPTVKWDLVNSYLFRDADGQVTLVDTGLKWAPKRILSAVTEIGSDPSDVTRIVLTHSHSDHVGGAAELVETTGAHLAVHSGDAESVRTGKTPPLDQSTLGGRLLKRPPSFAAVPDVEELADGQVIDVGGGLRVVHTPGHSPGHVSLVHEPSRLLITGDAIWNIRRRLTWPVLALCNNVRLTQQTADTLGELDYELVAFTHGPEIRENAREAVRGFLSEPRGFRGGL